MFGAALASASCATGGGTSAGNPTDPAVPPSATDQRLAAQTPHRLTASDDSKKIDAIIASHFAAHGTGRAYVMTDKPLYQPGETIWFRADLRATGTLIGGGPTGMTVQLISPRGAVTAQKRLLVDNGVAQNDFALPPELEGGEYTLQLTGDDGTSERKKLIVNTYEAPRLMKTVELVRKAYGPGDKVSAAVEVKRTTGEPFAQRALTGVVTVDDVEVARLPLRTDADGKTVASFTLPQTIARGDGLLTILADDGGVTESIQKRIPILLSTMQLSLYPEGGDLVDGVPGRVYFMARNTLGKPADIEGKIVDDRGTTVGELRSVHDGLGRFELQPATDRRYHVEVTRPAGIKQTFELPAAKSGGCALRALPDASPGALRVAATCTTSRELLVEAVLRERRVAGGAVSVRANEPAVLELPVAADAQGAVRVTLFSTHQEPLAERLVYHGRGQDLKVTLTADKKTYAPRDPVTLTVKATDPSGKPVKASLGVAVVDDTVLSFADDKSGRIRSQIYLAPELDPGGADPIEEPEYYFSDKPEAPAALDALLATRGYRRFEWQPVLSPAPAANEVMDLSATAAPAPTQIMQLEKAEAPRDEAAKKGERRPMRELRKAPVGGMAKVKTPPMQAPAAPPAAKAPRPVVVQGRIAKEDKAVFARGAVGRGRAVADKDIAGDDEMVDQIAAWAPVRVFPVPAYTRNYDGPRTDFRETIYWNANVQTSAEGTAKVTFVTSDALTAFRASAEGVSAGGLPGGGTATFQSKLPVTLDARLPLEVTSGDRIRLPVTVTNETDHAIDAQLDAQFGAAFKVAGAPAGKLHLAAGEKQAVFFPLDVVASDGDAKVSLALTTAGLKDQLDKTIRVVPLGFPFERSASGTAKAGAPARHDFELDGALPGSIRATVTMYPSPLAAMTKGMDAMIREPGGCFEQTSSTNYPNIMILGYLNANDAADPALLKKTQGTLDRGYKLLTGYETKQRGYEWFGQTPGHEALTAYGLMEFADMAKVYEVEPHMVTRTAEWLMSRRDKKGGFLRSSQALDSFGRAGQATTDAYIMWALAEAQRTKGMDVELAAQRTLAATSKDPYLLALAANTMILAQQPQASAAIATLAGLQAEDGSFPGAKESITMSGGESLTIEATALATLALIKASPNNEHEASIRRAVDYLNKKRGGFGQWSNTQATVLGLKAMTAYADHARQMQSDGAATLIINGAPAGTIKFDKGRKDALVWDDLAGVLKPGHNTVELQLAGGAQLPYSIAVEYRSAKPQSSPAAKVRMTTTLDRAQVKLGEGVKLRAHVENATAGGVPMTLARVGLPGGLTFQTWQLKELRDKGLIDFYETRPREVILYWRALPPNAQKDVALDLLAVTPGDYEAPASSAYLYYTAEDKAWASPVKVAVNAK